MKEILISRWSSPAGEMILGSVGEALCLADWSINRRRDSIDRRIGRSLGGRYIESSSPTIADAICMLEEYFSGRRRHFDIPLKICGTGFQTMVWEELRRVPYGSVISYMELASRIRRPEAVRAVANAVGANPLSILVPCHRVIGSDGSLIGYAGGLDAKRLLLSIESHV